MKTSSVVLLAVLTSVVACKSKYKKEFEAGDQHGYDRGMSDGEAYDGSVTYDDGFDDNGMLLTKMF